MPTPSPTVGHLPGLPADDGWHHVAMVIDRASARIAGYLDGTSTGWTSGAAGAPSDSIAGFGDIDTTEALLLGAVDQQGVHRNWYFGDLDEVRIYDRALTANEIQGVMSLGLLP